MWPLHPRGRGRNAWGDVEVGVVVLDALRRYPWLVLALLAGMALHSPATAAARAEQLPNLVPLAPFELELGTADPNGTSPPGPAIRFATGIANRSDYALELSGQPSGLSESAAQQCVAWAGPRVCSQRQPVGRFVWHPEHGHYHFEDFARYELRKVKPKGRVDMSDKGLVATSGKVSFCIIDVEPDGPPRHPLYGLPYPLYYSCLAGASMQGISPGWRDIYGKGTPGQQIPLDGIPDGIYALMVYIDPSERLYEASDEDNTSFVKLKLAEEAKTLEVLCAREPEDKTCTPVESES